MERDAVLTVAAGYTDAHTYPPTGRLRDSHRIPVGPGSGTWSGCRVRIIVV